MAEEPNLDAVRRAVVGYFEAGEVGVAAKAALAEWGTRALPCLERIARQGALVAAGLVHAVAGLHDQRAGQLLVAMLQGETGVDPHEAFQSLPLADGITSRDWSRHPGMKEAILTFVAGSFLEQGRVADAAATFGWTDVVPRIRRMLEHENHSVREKAAKALRTLTGERVDSRRPDISFPREDLQGSLLRLSPVAEPQEARSAHLGVCSRWDLSVRGHSPQVVEFEFTEGGAGAVRARAHDLEGNELWVYDAPLPIMQSAALLFDSDGAYGIALGPGGSAGIVAVGPSGDKLWDIQCQFVLYELRSYRVLPGWLLHIGSGCQLFRHGPTGAVHQDMTPFGTRWLDVRIYPTSGVLFPNDAGEPSIIVAGSGSRPAFFRFDASPERRWTATLPGRIGDIAMLDLGGERLFAAAADTGDLVVFDERGTLRWKGRLPGSQDDVSRYVISVEFAVTPEGSRRLRAHLVTETFTYDLTL